MEPEAQKALQPMGPKPETGSIEVPAPGAIDNKPPPDNAVEQPDIVATKTGSGSAEPGNENGIPEANTGDREAITLELVIQETETSNSEETEVTDPGKEAESEMEIKDSEETEKEELKVSDTKLVLEETNKEFEPTESDPEEAPKVSDPEEAPKVSDPEAVPISSEPAQEDVPKEEPEVVSTESKTDQTSEPQPMSTETGVDAINLFVKPSTDKVEQFSDDDIEVDSSSDSSSESDSTSDSDSVDDNNSDAESDEEIEESGPIQSKNEIAEEEAPSLPSDFKIPEDAPLELIGEITSIVEKSIIIKATISGEFRILKDGSIFCFGDKTVIGPLFEIFGKLQAPIYRVKFNSDEEVEKFKDRVGEKVYYVVTSSEFIYTDAIKKMKGTDASNCNDEELPEEEQEFSDDETEAAAKRKKSKKRKQKNKPEDSQAAKKKPAMSFTAYGYAPRSNPREQHPAQNQHPAYQNQHPVQNQHPTHQIPVPQYQSQYQNQQQQYNNHYQPQFQPQPQYQQYQTQLQNPYQTQLQNPLQGQNPYTTNPYIQQLAPQFAPQPGPGHSLPSAYGVPFVPQQHHFAPQGQAPASAPAPQSLPDQASLQQLQQLVFNNLNHGNPPQPPYNP